MKLDKQLSSIAAYGSSLRRKGSVKRVLEISTKSYLHTGEIAGYSEKVAGASRAAALVRKGTYIGVGLDVASSALDIHKACTTGREHECTKAKYVQGGSLVMGLGGGSIGGSVGSFLATAGCTFVLGVTTGPGALACAVLGGAVGGVVGGEMGAEGGEVIGDYLYRKVAE